MRSCFSWVGYQYGWILVGLTAITEYVSGGREGSVNWQFTRWISSAAVNATLTAAKMKVCRSIVQKLSEV
jgi:hypothetical protein